MEVSTRADAVLGLARRLQELQEEMAGAEDARRDA